LAASNVRLGKSKGRETKRGFVFAVTVVAVSLIFGCTADTVKKGFDSMMTRAPSALSSEMAAFSGTWQGICLVYDRVVAACLVVEAIDD
jgi:hypothetical protein